jgi:hypothetical protein
VAVTSLSAARRIVALAVVVGSAATLAAVVGAHASPPIADVDDVAARYPVPVGDLVTVFDIGEVDAFVVDASARAASTAGGAATVGRTGSLGMRELRRGATVVHAPPSPYLIPMVYSSFPANPMGRVMGWDVANQLGPGKVVMHEVTAGLMGAQVGDTIVMQAADGSPVSLDVVDIRPVDEIGWAELVFTYDVAVALGATDDTRVVLHDFDRDLIEDALAAQGLIDRTDTRVYRSWDPPNPDGTLSTAQTKQALGEPWYRFHSDGSISMHPTWEATYLPPGREFLNETIRIWTRCHLGVVDDLRAALAEVVSAGLASTIDWYNANRYGGCYGPRFSRSSGQIGFLSRHSYAMAFDTNTVENCFGCIPRMDCETVRIFRKHGFAWGGNFRRPDGMHFEWVGERRDLWEYPSNYCPNPTAGLGESVGGAALGLGVLTIEGEEPLHVHPDGASGHDH